MYKQVRAILLFVMATRKIHALVQVYLTTANQSEICKAYLVSVMATRKIHAFVQVHLTVANWWNVD